MAYRGCFGRRLVGFLFVLQMTGFAAAYTVYGDREPVETLYPSLVGPVQWSGAGFWGWQDNQDVSIAVHIPGDRLDNAVARSLFKRDLADLDQQIAQKGLLFWREDSSPNPVVCMAAKNVEALKTALLSDSRLKAMIADLMTVKESFALVWKIPGNSTNTEWKSPAFAAKVYPGLFLNPDDSRPDRFLQEDAQTAITSEIRRLGDLVSDKKDRSTLKEIYNLILETVKNDRPRDFPLFESTARSILTCKIATGCTDYAIAFATLARYKGIPSIIVNAAQTDWVRRGAKLNAVAGHFFVEVLVGGQWLLVDSTAGVLYTEYDRNNWVLPNNYIAFAKSLSVIDSGMTEDNMTLLQRVALWGHEFSYQEPEYPSLKLADTSLRERLGPKVAALNLSARQERVRTVYDATQPSVVVRADPLRVIPGLLPAHD